MSKNLKKGPGKPQKYDTPEERIEALKGQKRNWWRRNRGVKKRNSKRSAGEDYSEIRGILIKNTEDLKVLQEDVYRIKQSMWQNSIGLNGGSK